MKAKGRAITKEFDHRLREARREVWRTVVGTTEELATLEAEREGVDVLARLDTAERRLLGEIDAARARLATGTFGTCERCGQAIPLARLRALPAARLCVVCERDAESAASA